MAPRPDTDMHSTRGDLEIRPPQQLRSRKSWARILDSGVKILEEGGYQAFTIAAVCERAGVVPRAIYARADSKDALFLAVYEHASRKIDAEQIVFADDDHWGGFSPPELVAEAVLQVTNIFRRHSAFLRPVVLVSGADDAIYRAGSANTKALADRFTERLLRSLPPLRHPDRNSAVRMCFSMVFYAIALRNAYGTDFAGPDTDLPSYAAGLQDMAIRYLLA